MSVLRAYRGLLSNGPLVRLLGGEFISSIGDWLYLVALLIVGPTLAFALPLALRNGVPSEPVEFTFARWLGVLIPVLGAAALLASRAYVRSTGASSTSVAS